MKRTPHKIEKITEITLECLKQPGMNRKKIYLTLVKNGIGLHDDVYGIVRRILRHEHRIDPHTHKIVPEPILDAEYGSRAPTVHYSRRKKEKGSKIFWAPKWATRDDGAQKMKERVSNRIFRGKKSYIFVGRESLNTGGQVETLISKLYESFPQNIVNQYVSFTGVTPKAARRIMRLLKGTDNEIAQMIMLAEEEPLLSTSQTEIPEDIFSLSSASFESKPLPPSLPLSQNSLRSLRTRPLDALPQPLHPRDAFRIEHILSERDRRDCKTAP
jgi:hypothetical protein